MPHEPNRPRTIRMPGLVRKNLPWAPETDLQARFRFRKSLRQEYDLEAVQMGSMQAPQESRRQVFDLKERAMRVVAWLTRDSQGRHVIMTTAAPHFFTPAGWALYIKMIQAEGKEAALTQILDAIRAVLPDSVAARLENSGGPHWHAYVEEEELDALRHGCSGTAGPTGETGNAGRGEGGAAEQGEHPGPA